MALPASKIDTVFEMLAQSDALIAKALGISEVAQIARIESNLRKYIDGKWNELKAQAIKEAHSMAMAGKGHSAISAKVIRTMSRIAFATKGRLSKDVKSIYEKARVAAWRKYREGLTATLAYDTPNFSEVKKAGETHLELKPLPTFTTADANAQKAISKIQYLWLKEHVPENMAASIRETVREVMLVEGQGRAAAGTELKRRLTEELGRVKTPAGWNGTQRQYFEGVSSNASTTARVHGHMNSFTEFGAKKYEILAAGDERTCPVCSQMDGKVFTVKQGASVMSAEMAAKNPSGAKAAHPWYSEKELQKISTGSGHVSAKDSQALAAAGFSTPPFHFRCRCTVSVSDAPGSF